MASRLMCSFEPTIQTFSQIFVVGVCQETMFRWPQNIARWPWLSIPHVVVVYLNRDKNSIIKFVFVFVCLLACIAWALTSKVTRKRERKQTHHFWRGSSVQGQQTVSHSFISISIFHRTLLLCITCQTLLFNNFTLIFRFYLET